MKNTQKNDQSKDQLAGKTNAALKTGVNQEAGKKSTSSPKDKDTGTRRDERSGSADDRSKGGSQKGW